MMRCVIEVSKEKKETWTRNKDLFSFSSNVSCSPHQNVREDERSVALNSTNWLNPSRDPSFDPSFSFIFLSILPYFSIFC